ncbi:apolipophorins [Conger conger]|uniref:apolipophorins n=1 Tax=Conger conger TaxID=82655 RepID=UPI002A5AD31D|nr:apolipophorins [Conger conger]
MAPQRMLLVEMGNTTVSISPEGQVEVNCRIMDAPVSHNEVTIRREPNIIEVSNQDGALVTCDFSQALCSLTLDGWQHGISAGLLGTNDNEAGNERPLPDGSQANGLAHFIHSWQVRPQCRSESGKTGLCSNTSRHNLTTDVTRCVSLFSSPDSPLSPCFRVVDPMQFLSVCKRRRCASIPDKVPCRLAVAFVHLCNRNYVPLELPQQCGPY